MSMLLLIALIMYGHFEWRQICTCFLYCCLMSFYQEEKLWTGLTEFYLPQARTWISIEIWFERFCSYWNRNCLSFLEHLNWSPVFSVVLVTWSSILCVWFVDSCLSFCTFSFCHHCVVCPSSIYCFWLHIWYH